MKQATHRRRRRAPAGRGASTAREAGQSGRLAWVLPVLAALAAFWPLLGADFTSWDDLLNVAKNPFLNPPSFHGLGLFWARPFLAIYIPLTYTLWSVIALVARTDAADVHGIWLNPYIFHAANLAVHIVAAVAVYLVLRRLVGKPWAACAGAVLFAVHPVQVESVGWVAGMKDVLCGAFSMLATWQYLLFAKPDDAENSAPGRRRLHYAVATVAFGLALLSKPSAISLPLVVLVLDYGLLRRPWRAVLLCSLPWFAMAAPIAIVAKIAQPVTVAYEGGRLWLRPLLAADALGFYAYKLLFPHWLAMQYHHSPQVEIAQGRVYFLWLIPAVIGLAAWIFRRKAPWFAVGVLIMVAATLPVLGLVPFHFERYSLVADHYLYVAMLGPALILAFAVQALKGWRATPIVVTAVLLLLALRANLQTWSWRSTEDLFRHELAINPQSAMAYTSLSGYELTLNEPGLGAAHARQAEAYARQAIELDPDDSEAWGNLGVALSVQGRTPDAISAARRASELNPSDARALANLAGLLPAQGKFDEAMDCARRALELDNLLPEAHRNLAVLLAARKQYLQAVSEAEIAVRLDPGDVRGQLNLAVLLETVGHRQQAIEHYAAALRLDPNSQLAKRGLAGPLLRPSPRGGHQ